MKKQTTRIERIFSQIKSNPIVASLIVLGTIVIALSTFTDAAKRLFSIVAKQSPEAARSELAGLSLQYTPDAFVQSADNGDLNAVKLFLRAGMDPGATDDEGSTALMQAAWKGHTKVVAALLKAGADVNQRKGRHSALLSAASGGHIDSLRILLDKGPDAEVIDDAFVEAVKTRHHEIARVLAERGADVKKVGTLAMTVLAEGGWGDEEVRDTVKFLLDLGANANGGDTEGWTVLMEAANSGYPSTVRVLVDRGADVNAKCSCPGVLDGGWTALMLAINKRRHEVVEGLLDKGADVNQRNNRGETALILAAHQFDIRTLEGVLGRSTDVNVKDRDGRTALMWVSAGTSYPDQVIDHPEAVLALLAKGAEVNVQDAHGRTPLMLATESASTRVVRTLLQAGAHVNDKDVDGYTALRYAQKNLEGQKKAEMVRVLEEAGAK